MNHLGTEAVARVLADGMGMFPCVIISGLLSVTTSNYTRKGYSAHSSPVCTGDIWSRYTHTISDNITYYIPFVIIAKTKGKKLLSRGTDHISVTQSFFEY